jgi:type I restriction enzyme, S subunit
MVPRGWTVDHLDAIASVVDSLHQTPEFEHKGFPMVRVADVKNRLLDLKDTAKVSEKVFKEFTKKYKPCRHDIVYSRVGSYGNASYVNTNEEFCLGQNTVVISADEGLDSYFLFLQLQSDHVKQQIEKAVDGSSHKTISLKLIRSLRIPRPSLLEQRKIANVLRTWDEAIDRLEHLIALKRERKRALMQGLLTGWVRFKEFEGLEWKEVQLDKYASKRKGKNVQLNNEKQGLPYIGSVAFSGSYLQFTTDPNAEKCEPEDVLLLWDGEYAGKSSTGHRGAVGSTVCALKLKPQLNNHFLHNLLTYDNYRIRAVREGSGIPHMPGDFAHWYRFRLPPLAEQRRIASVLSSADAEVETLGKQLEAYKLQKRGLMQQLLTGKKRVRVEEQVPA